MRLRYTFYIILMCFTFSGRVSSQADTQTLAGQVRLPAIFDGPGVAHTDLPLKSISAAVSRHPHIRVFLIEYNTLLAQTGKTLSVYYDRKQGTVRLAYVERWPGQLPSTESYLITHVTDAAIRQAARNGPTGDLDKFARFETLIQYGCKMRRLIPTSIRMNRAPHHRQK